MKLSSFITAALAAASTAYALDVGDPAIAPRALTTKYFTKYWNTTITNSVGGVGAENAGATRTGGVRVVIPSGTGNIGPIGTSMILPINGTGRYKYTGTVGVAPGLDVTTVLSFVTVVPTPAKNVTIKTGTAGVAPTGYVHAYYGDPLRHQHLVSVIPDKTVVDNKPTAILATEVIRTPGTFNNRDKRETVEEALNASLSAKEKRFSTHRAGFMAHTHVFVRPARPTGEAQKRLVLRRRDAEDDILTEDDLGYIAALNLRLGHMINVGLISEDTTIEELASLFGDDEDLEKRQSLVPPCKLVGEKFSVAQCIPASVNLPKGPGKKIGAGAGRKIGGRDEVNLPKGAGKKIGASAARKLGSPVRSSQDDLTKNEIEIGAGVHDSYETHVEHPAAKFPKQGTHGAIVHISNGSVVTLDDNGAPTGTQPEIDAKLPLPTLDDPQFRNFWSWKNVREWSEKHFAQRLGPRDQVEDVEVVEFTGQPIEVAKREALRRVALKDISKNFPKVKLVGDKVVSTPAVDATVTVTVWDCGTQAAGNAKRQVATVGTEYGNQNPDMVSFEKPTTFRTVKVSLAGGVPGLTVDLSVGFPTPTATAGTEYGNQNPDMVDLLELGIQRTFSRITDAAEATAYAKRQTELENLNMVVLEEATTLRSVGVVLSSNGPAPTVDLSAGFSTPTATADNLYGYQNPNMVDLTELGIQRTFSRVTDAAEVTEA